MNLAENRRTKILLIVLKVMFEDNRQHVVHKPGLFSKLLLLSSSESKTFMAIQRSKS